MGDEVKNLAEEYAINIVAKYGKPLYDQWGQNRVELLDTVRTELIHRVASEEFFPEGWQT
jgi:predicted Zn-dependent protease with MMP-like domain